MTISGRKSTFSNKNTTKNDFSPHPSKRVSPVLWRNRHAWARALNGRYTIDATWLPVQGHIIDFSSEAGSILLADSARKIIYNAQYFKNYSE